MKLQVFETALSSNHAFCHTIDDVTGPAEAAGILVGDIITAARIFSFLGETFPLEDIIGFRAWSLEASMRVIQYHASLEWAFSYRPPPFICRHNPEGPSGAKCV